jgi:phosphatidate cytidylyltransferase
MRENLFYVILLFFFLGGTGIYFIGKKQNPMERKENRLKYCTYFFIVAFLYGCICFADKIFPCICSLIAFAGLFEIVRLQRNVSQKRAVFYGIIFVYMLIGAGFYFFGRLSQPVLLYTFLMVCLFDAFCQTGGQLLGKHKIFTGLSPNKTYEGLFSGLFTVIGASPLIGRILGFSVFNATILGLSICLFSFIGDLSASWVKRRYGVKDFSSILPGHGGFLDRFDSFMISGVFVYLISLFFEMV